MRNRSFVQPPMLAPINLRFAELIQEIGLTKNAFAQSLGKTASVIQHLIDGRNKPGYDLLCKVFEVYPNVSKDWLMEGSGPMLRTGAPKAALGAAGPAAAALAVALKKAPAATPLFASATAEVAPEPKAMPASAAVSIPPADTLGAPATLPVTAAGASAATSADAVGAALQTQHLLHQLALAELRNQHLLEQQLLLRQMLELAQRR